jgi:GH15 family glucan-1,4-alpha-glucosidase
VWLRGLQLSRTLNTSSPGRYSAEKKFYAQSYENLEVMDSAVLIMPLVFFTSAADERFKSTLDQILKTPEKGGLTANNTVFRYDTEKADDGIGGEEGAFSMCTLWAIGKLTNVDRGDYSQD